MDKEDMRNKFCENLESLLKEKRITQKELARQISCSPKTVQEWCGKNGRIPRNPHHLKLIAQVLEVSVHFLLFGHEETNPVSKIDLHNGTYEITIKKIEKK